MPKNKNSYWAERARKDKLKVIKTGEQGIDNLKRLLLLNLKDVEKQIKDFYEKYGDNPAEELSNKNWQRYKKRLRDMAQANPQDKTLQKLAKQNIPKYKIDRLRALELDLQMQLTEATNGQAKGIYNTLDDVSKVSQATLASRMNKTLGLTFNAISSNKMKQILMSDWSGANWSERLWKDREKVGKKLTEVLEKGIPQGVSLQKMSRELRDLTGESFNNAFRLIRTETSHIDGQVTLEGYKQASEELGLQYYEYDAFLDSRTSSFCRELDGKRFKITDAEVGVNYPPRHPNCRSTTQLVLDEDYKPKATSAPSGNNNLKYDKSIEKVVLDIQNTNDRDIKEMFNNMSKLKSVNIQNTDDIGKFDPKTYTILINFGQTDITQKLAHELGHYFDYALVDAQNKSVTPFSKAYKTQIDSLKYKDINKIPMGVINKFKNIMNAVDKNGIGDLAEKMKWQNVSDIFDNLTEGELYTQKLCPYGHTKNYYQEDTNRKYTELFANYFTLKTLGNMEQLEFLEKYAPDLSQILDNSCKIYVKEVSKL